MMDGHFQTEISYLIWRAKYRYEENGTVEPDVTASWRRVARALARVESGDWAAWEERFYAILEGFRFLPGGRILAGAGTGRQVTLFNCFVMGRIEDSMDGIFDALKEGALTMQQGGGVGYDFSTLRPRGTRAHKAGTTASGPVSFMRIWDSMCATVLSTGARRGAMMATLRCDHPDVETFIAAKADPHELRHFNLSVQVSDGFMEALERDEEWALVFPLDRLGQGGSAEVVERDWPGSDGPVPCRVFKRLPARELWERITRASYDYAEPGVFFVDRANALNNLWYRERISATNPCGEIPLQPYGACDLGSINLVRFVTDPFGADAALDWEGLRETVRVAVRLMDNVIDASHYPLAAQAGQAQGTRRIGLGLTGLGDALIMLGLHYGTGEARAMAAEVMRTICHTAYRTSIQLAREKGPFPFFQREQYLAGGFIAALPEELRQDIAAHGIRNSHLTAIAPTGTISLLANNVSSGLEPVFDYGYSRALLERDGLMTRHEVEDYAYRLWRTLRGDAPLPESFVQATALDPDAHLDMQAALQPFVDNAISKTINIPEGYPLEAFARIYEKAYARGLKGCTTFRPNPITGAILQPGVLAGPGAPCCGPEREPD